jgi:putative DNA primase/helicase
VDLAVVSDEERQRAVEIDRVMSMLRRPPGITAAGDPKPPTRSAQNTMTVLEEDPWFATRIHRDAFAGVVMFDGVPLTDEAVTAIRLIIADAYGFEPSAALTHECVMGAASTRERHPVRAYLTSLTWDGVPRLGDLLTRYAGAEATPLVQRIARCFMLSCVARVMEPGCKVDTVLILQGPQGAGKSRLFRALCGPQWFADSAIDLRSKDAYLALRGRWIYEMAELAAMRPRDAETVKAFISAQVDHYRPPYGRVMVEIARQCVIVGTTNETAFLADPTGARRFWPVTVGAIDLEALAADRDQLWAEAMEAHQGGESWWLMDEEDAAALRELHEQYQHEDPWEGVVRDWLAREKWNEPVTVSEIMSDALAVPVERQTKALEMRLGGVLQRLGRERRRVRKDGSRVWVWA